MPIHELTSNISKLLKLILSKGYGYLWPDEKDDLFRIPAFKSPLFIIQLHPPKISPFDRGVI